MALSEDATAIVAANLTIAHCALLAPYRPDPDDAARKLPQQVVEDIFQGYLKRLPKAHQLTHPDPAPD